MSRLHGDQRHDVCRGPFSGLQQVMRHATGGVMALLVVMLITACGGGGEETDNRQFANQPRTPQPTATAAPALPGTRAATPVPPEASPVDLMAAHNAPTTVYAVIAGALRSFDGDTSRVIVEAPVMAYAASPDGTQVAVLTAAPAEEDGTRYGLRILNREGTRVAAFDQVLTVPVSQATPTSKMASSPSPSVSWAPQGRHVLVAVPSGQLADLSLDDGGVTRIATRTPLTGLAAAKWSPDGDVIGVLRRDADGVGELALVDPASMPATVTVIAPAGDMSGEVRSVEQFAWQPDGTGVFLLRAHQRHGDMVDGKILAWEAATNTSRIIATGGQVGPSGSIKTFSISPDGKAMLYRIGLRANDGWSFGGMYVQSPATGQTRMMPVAPDADATGGWWIEGGIVWTEKTHPDNGAGAVVRVVMVGTDEDREQLATFALTHGATPGASPVAATPAGSPSLAGASPVATATPGATSAGSPAASVVSATPGAGASPVPHG